VRAQRAGDHDAVAGLDEAATFSASSRQQLTPNQMVSPSAQAPVALSTLRGRRGDAEVGDDEPLATTRVRGGRRRCRRR
jgi:hypothetical protein